MREFPKFLPWLFLGAALVFFTSPFWLYWYIHGDYERYIRTINGPYPLSHFGSGPFQLWMMVGFLIISVISAIVSLLLFKMSKFK